MASQPYLERTSLEARPDRTEEGDEEVSCEKTTIWRADLDLTSSTQKPRLVPTRQVWLVERISSLTVSLAVRRLGRSSSLLSTGFRSVSSIRTERMSQPGSD